MSAAQKILVTGANGFIGNALCQRLLGQGDTVYALGRRAPEIRHQHLHWIEWSGTSMPDTIPENLDAVVNLAGENIAAGRWTASRKRQILESRVELTTLLVQRLKKLKQPPRQFLSASAVGYYGDRADQKLTEEAEAGSGFLAEVTCQWEEAALEAKETGASVTLMRFGVVLDRSGGALKRMLLPFRCGAGGPLGSGKQFMSWIALDDLVSGILFLLGTDLHGPVNVVAPSACTNREFATALGAALGRPAILRLPAWLLRLLFGQMGTELFLFSIRAEPSRLTTAGFAFRHARVESVFASLNR